MNIFFIGDVVAKPGLDFLSKHLWSLRKLYAVDVVIANGENATPGNGLMPKEAKQLFDMGVDVITSGNHIFNRKESFEMLQDSSNIIRPANYPKTVPGNGYCIFKTATCDVLVINLLGTVFMDPLDSPFYKADEIIEKHADIKIKIVDFHAEATSEKKTMGYYLDGRVSAVIGTHTHVATADEQMLDNGTAFISDVGMTGPYKSVLGVKKEAPMTRIIEHLPARFEAADGPCSINAVLLEIDDSTGKCSKIERICIK